MKRILKDCILFIVFGAIYFLIECLWKGHLTHWTMFVLAGFLGVIIGGINEHLPWEWSLPWQSICGAAIVTLAEGISGLILNVFLKLNIWDYSHTCGHFFFNQCCLPFSLAWIGLSCLCIILDDVLRWKLFNEEKPHYKL